MEARAIAFNEGADAAAEIDQHGILRFGRASATWRFTRSAVSSRVMSQTSVSKSSASLFQ
ncbi:MAG: hypothetical protein WDM89_00315 [Rhizomicrobium sp.]